MFSGLMAVSAGCLLILPAPSPHPPCGSSAPKILAGSLRAEEAWEPDSLCQAHI